MHCIMLNKSEHFCLNIHSIFVGVSPLDGALCTRVFFFVHQETPHDTSADSMQKTGIFNGQRKTNGERWKKFKFRQWRQAGSWICFDSTNGIHWHEPPIFAYLSTPFMSVCRVNAFLAVIAFYPFFSSGLFDMKCTQNSHLSLVHVIFWANKKLVLL